MAIFRYQAMDHAGRYVQGSMEATDETTLSASLAGDGLFLVEAAPIDIAGAQETAAAAASGPSIPLQDVESFTTQLTLMMRSSLPAMQAIDSLVPQQKNASFREILIKIKEHLERGEPLSMSFGKYPQAFDNVYVNLVAAGEASGKVPEMMSRIGDHLMFQMELRRKVQAAMIYPVVVLGASVTVILFLMLFVLPTFVEIFAQFDAPLPLPTRMLLWCSTILRTFWWALAGGAFGGWVWLKRWYAVTENRELVEERSLSIPIMGNMIRSIVLTRLLRTFAILSKSGVPILTALELTRMAVGNSHFERLLDRVAAFASEGRGIAAAMYDDKHFPVVLANMIATSETSGNMPEVLALAAEQYQRDLDAAIESTFAALEPLFIGCLSLVVAGIAVCIMQPMMNLGSIVD